MITEILGLIEPYGEMVFACNPDTCADVFVYPLSRTLEDFMRLILACGSANPVEQIIWMDKDKFAKHLKEEEALRTEEQKLKQRTYIAIDLKSFYASVKCRDRGLDPLDTNLVVADESWWCLS